MRVLVTGGSGIVGHYVIDELYKNGYEVVNADLQRIGDLSHSGNIGKLANAKKAIELRSNWPTIPKFFEVDISNYGQVISAMDGCDAVISLASRPSAANYTEEDVVLTNTMSMWNVCRAAEQLGINRVILGSSYNAVGAMGTAARWQPHQVKPPEYFPLDQDTNTRAEDPYSVAKWLGEQIADSFIRRSSKNMFIVSLRFNGMWDDDYFRVLNKNPITDVWTRCQGFWTYLHLRDAARACVMSLECKMQPGHWRLFLNASDTMINIPTLDALKIVYPDTPIRGQLPGYKAPISISLAQRIIGWQPIYSWRDKQFTAS